jgi:uncharacterized membrane protein YqaE (UPF0057 family)
LIATLRGVIPIAVFFDPIAVFFDPIAVFFDRGTTCQLSISAKKYTPFSGR